MADNLHQHDAPIAEDDRSRVIAAAANVAAEALAVANKIESQLALLEAELLDARGRLGEFRRSMQELAAVAESKAAEHAHG